MIPKSQIDAVKERADIAEIISGYGVSLKGSGTLKGLCPFHDESTPSFTVRPTFGTYRCFGCGESGDVFSFVQEKDGLSFTDAVKMVAERYGIEITDSQDAEDEGDRANKRRLFDLMKEAARFFTRNYKKLDADHPARVELRKRNLEEIPGEPQWLERFGIGYAPDGWTHTVDHLTSKGYTHDEIISAGMAGRSENGRVYDMFRGRLTWQIRDIQGRVIGFGARKLFDTDKGPKYLNSPVTPLYDKSKVLYGMDLARQTAYATKELIVVEGYTDVMAYAAVGIDNAVAPCGTAFGDQHAVGVRRLLGEDGKIIFSFDGDAAGQKAASHVFSLKAPIHNNSFVATSPGSGDPCDIRLNQGDSALIDHVSSSNLIPLTDFVLKAELAKHDTATPEGRSNFLRAAAPLLAHITDYSMREDYLRRVTFWSGSTIDVVRATMKRLNNSGLAGSSALNDELPPIEHYEDETPQEKSLVQSKIESLVALMLQYPAEYYAAMRHREIPDSVAQSPIANTYTEAWMLIQAQNGNLGTVSPDEFSDSALVSDLIFKPFPHIENVQDQQRKQQLVARLIQSTLKGVEDIERSEQAENLRARLGRTYGGETGETSNDIKMLGELLSQQQKLRRRR